MRLDLHRRGAIIPQELRRKTDPHEVHREMLWVEESVNYDWDDPFTAEFWDRWLLDSYPSVEQAKLFMTMRKGVLFMP
jgi:hypothetical protein